MDKVKQEHIDQGTGFFLQLADSYGIATAVLVFIILAFLALFLFSSWRRVKEGKPLFNFREKFKYKNYSDISQFFIGQIIELRMKILISIYEDSNKKQIIDKISIFIVSMVENNYQKLIKNCEHIKKVNELQDAMQIFLQNTLSETQNLPEDVNEQFKREIFTSLSMSLIWLQKQMKISCNGVTVNNIERLYLFTEQVLIFLEYLNLEISRHYESTKTLPQTVYIPVSSQIQRIVAAAKARFKNIKVEGAVKNKSKIVELCLAIMATYEENIVGNINEENFKEQSVTDQYTYYLSAIHNAKSAIDITIDGSNLADKAKTFILLEIVRTTDVAFTCIKKYNGIEALADFYICTVLENMFLSLYYAIKRHNFQSHRKD